MTAPLTVHPAREQAPFAKPPYDRWITEGGEVTAEFHRTPTGYCLRFPGDADFSIDAATLAIACTPVPSAPPDLIATLHANAVLPVVGNHRGELNLHGSACVTPHGAAAFVGHSRRGKTTLAAAFAREGHPFLSEDVIRLSSDGAAYTVAPARPLLRLFGDSAAWLETGNSETGDAQAKITLEAGPRLPFAQAPAPLRAIYVLGPGAADAPVFAPLDARRALVEIMQHAFVLDVEDKPRLHAHFERLSDLALQVPFVLLDYPRRFADLPQVVAAVAGDLSQRGAFPNDAR